MNVVKHQVFKDWYNDLDMTQKIQIDVRVTRIIVDSHFGDSKRVGKLNELRFKSGLRVYYGKIGNEYILLLNGGGKNSQRDQSRDIKKAEDLFAEYQNGK